jgi:hypothetical protein
MLPILILKNTRFRLSVLLVALSGLACHAPVQAAVTVFSDNFNTVGGINSDLATRQSGSLATANWNNYNGVSPSIVGNQITATNSGYFNEADLYSSFTDTEVTGFRVSFDAQHLGGDTGWISPFLSTHEGGGDDRGATQFGLLIFGNGSVRAYINDGGSQASVGADNDTISGLVSGWDPNNINSYSLVATKTTATTGTYDVFINGVEILSDVDYSFTTGAEMKTGFTGLYWAQRDMNVANAYDNLLIETIPEPSTALLGAIGLMVALLRRRR